MPIRPSRLATLVVCVFSLAMGTACSDEAGVTAVQSHAGTDAGDHSGSTTDTAVTSDPQPEQPSITWTGASGGTQQGTIEVPIDYDDPGGGSFTLHLVRHRAQRPSERIGTLLVNPGGPGAPGSELAAAAEQTYDQALLDAFDIVGWDPRGTGSSTPAIDCIEDYDTYFSLDSSPDSPQEQQAIIDAATKFGEACQRKNAAILAHVSTEESARDMDMIRRALGEDKISYFGFSYGSELGTTWASLFPSTVRAMVVDGAADQTVGYLQQNVEQAAGFDQAFATFLQKCSADTTCAFHNGGDAEQAYDSLSAAVDRQPVPSVSGRPAITQGMLDTAVANAMYSDSLWPTLERALADLQQGDGAAILDLYDGYYGRGLDGTYSNETEAYFAINCLDDPGTKDPQTVFDLQSTLADAAPHLGPSWVEELVFCAMWPVPPAPSVATDAKGAGPIVVVGTTGDPATPLDGTRATSDALEDGHLIVVTAEQHTGYGANDCVDAAVDHYLVDLTVPPDGLTCDR